MEEIEIVEMTSEQLFKITKEMFSCMNLYMSNEEDYKKQRTVKHRKLCNQVEEAKIAILDS